MTRRSAAAIARAVDQAMGRTAPDLVIADVRLYDLVTGDLVATDIAVGDGRIVATHGRFEGVETLDGAGRIAVPGFIDTHLHIESSLVTPREFDRMVLPHGVTTAIWDPHEIANVLGADGLRYALAAACETIMDISVNLSSCVPATHLETSGATLDAAALVALRDHPKVIGLAEFMNFPGVVGNDPGCLEKLAAFSDGHIDGHAPLVRGAALNAYLAAGIRTDHETTTAEEAREKLAKGMALLIREGSVSKDLHALAPVLTLATSPFCGLCTDDRNPLDIAEEGHLDFMIRELIRLGVPPLAAYRAASWSGATAFGLRDRGLIAPGRRADIALIDSLADCRVSDVVCGGRVVGPDLFAGRARVSAVGLDSVKATPATQATFAAPARNGTAHVIGVIPGKIITEHLRLDLPARDGGAAIDLAQDVVKVAVIERHGRNGNVAVGFVKGFGLKRGAIASSVGHDSHNICVVGADEADMAVAANRLIALRGGFVVADGGEVRAELALPVAGLMSEEPFETIRETLIALRQAARALGCTLAEPFLQVAFLPLPVIPHLKITDRGMVDVDRFDFAT
jgi:adenine deaminase